MKTTKKDFTFKRFLFPRGNGSVAITIPIEIVKKLRYDETTQVKITLEGKTIKISR